MPANERGIKDALVILRHDVLRGNGLRFEV